MSEVETAGQCLCGAVRYKIKGAPVRMALCHCKDCQRETGTGHAANAIFSEADVERSGETKSYAVTADSGNTLTRHFCPTCGSFLFAFNSGRPGMIVVTAGTMDDSSWFAPQTIIYTKRRNKWDNTGTDIPNLEAGIAIPPTA